MYNCTCTVLHGPHNEYEHGQSTRQKHIHYLYMYVNRSLLINTHKTHNPNIVLTYMYACTSSVSTELPECFSHHCCDSALVSVCESSGPLLPPQHTHFHTQTGNMSHYEYDVRVYMHVQGEREGWEKRGTYMYVGREMRGEG